MADDRSVINAVSQIVAVALAHYLLVLARQMSPVVGRIVDGTPVLLLAKGNWEAANMAAMQIQDDDVMALARDKGIERLDQIEYAVLERNGQISIISFEN